MNTNAASLSALLLFLTIIPFLGPRQAPADNVTAVTIVQSTPLPIPVLLVDVDVAVLCLNACSRYSEADVNGGCRSSSSWLLQRCLWHVCTQRTRLRQCTLHGATTNMATTTCQEDKTRQVIRLLAHAKTHTPLVRWHPVSLTRWVKE